MPFTAGHKFSRGRPKGSVNRNRRTVEEIAETLGVNPFEILIRFAAGDWKGLGYDSEVMFSESGEGDGKRVIQRYTITPEIRLDAAKSAVKYLFSQKQSVEVTGADGSAFKLVIEDYSKCKKSE